MRNHPARTENILRRLKETLETAGIGLDTLRNECGSRKLAGLRNLIVFGRAVTNVLQNLRTTEPSFDDWYRPYQDEMASDPVMRYFYTLRSQVLKEGKLPTGVSVYIHHLTFPQDSNRFGPPPPGAKRFFIGDQTGGSGWEVELPDGTTTKFYADMPGDIGQIEVHFPEAPTTHLGNKVPDKKIETLGSLYYEYLERLVAAAHEKFLGGI